MKKILLIIPFLISLNILFAQSDTIVPPIPPAPQSMDSTKVNNRGNKKFNIEIGDTDNSKKVRTRWLMLDYGMSTYLYEGSMNLPASLDPVEQTLLGSNNWAFHVVKQRVSLQKKNRVNLIYGLTLDFNKYKFNNDYTLLSEQNEVTFMDNPGVDFKKNSLHTTHLIAPFMLGFRLRPKRGTRSFNLKVGGYGGFLLASKTKQKVGGEKKITIRDDFNLNRTRFGLRAEAGYGLMNFYVNYNLSPLFKESEQGDFDLQAISFGFSIIPF
ncbi:MAG: hypothetical protein ACI94Y_003723 [Maribacter sp.]|jgi:hypothetical protein